MNSEVVSNEITKFIIDTVLSVGSTGCVIGLSGGIDSSTTLCLIKKAFDKYNKTVVPNKKLELVALILPSSVAKEEESNAIAIAEFAKVDYKILNIDAISDSFKNSFKKELNKLDVRAKGNLMSRIRANIISSFAEMNNKTICGTGNNDEDFGIGYYTLFGDGAVHMSPIAGLSKRLVRQMAEFLGLPEKTINQIPCSGLEPDQTDFKDIGYGYDLVEAVKEGLNQGFTESELVKNNFILGIAQKDKQDYKRYYEKEKFTDLKDMIKDIIKRNKLAKLKAQIICVHSPKITLKYKK